MTGGLAGIIDSVFGKFDGKAVKRALVESGNETFYDLPGNEFEVIELLELLYVCKIPQ
jgi:hypothetical protein